MRIKSLNLSVLILIFFVSQAVSQLQSQESLIPDAVDEYRKDFWITTKTTSTGKYLIKVLLPGSYFNSDTTKYPVLYLTDADWFFGTASDCAYWLGLTKKEIILVGISYGSPEVAQKNRTRDFYQGTDQFLSFFHEELIPKIESKFKVDRSNRTLFGWSAGAYFVLNVIYKQPELFHNYLSLGTPLNRSGWSAFEMEEEFFQKRKDLPIRLYMGTGELDLYASPSFYEFVQKLEKRGYEGFEFEWQVLKNKRHEYKSAAQLLIDGVDYIYGNKSIVTAMLIAIKEGGIENGIAEYHRLKEKDPDGYNFSAQELGWLAGGLASQKRYEEAAEIDKLAIHEFPASWRAYYYLGSHYLHEGNKELAKKYLEKALELNQNDRRILESLEKVRNE